MKFRTALLFVFFYLLAATLSGQESFSYKNKKFKHLSLEEGLSQSSVLCVLQDHNGFLWFGTRDGLNKYDGYTFKKYRYNAQNAESLSNSYVRSIYEDENNNLWIGTNNGLNRYVPNKDSFKRYRQNSDKIKTESNNEIWSIISGKKDYLFLGTGYGIKKFNMSNGKFSSFDNLDKNKNGIGSTIIRNLLRTSDGNLWICSNTGVAVYNSKKGIIKRFSHLGNVATGIAIELPILYEDHNKNLWLGFKGGLAYFNKKKNAFESFEVYSGPNLKITDEVRTIRQSYLGTLWVGTYNGIYIVNRDKSLISHSIHDENDPNSLSQNSIYTIAEDSKGDVWVGTYAGGVNYYDRSYDLFKNFSSGTNNSKLNYKVVSSIVEDPDQNLWIGTEGGGINFYNQKTRKFTYYQHNENDANSLSTDNVKSMIRTQNGNFWIGTHDGGLNFLNPKQFPYKFKKYKSIVGVANSLSNNRIISLLEDYKNDIWIGTSGGGINVFEHTSQSFSKIEDPLEKIGSIIYSISKTSDKNILLIAGNKGLSKVNILNHKIIPIYYKIKKDSYNTSATLFAYEDHNKNLWITTEGDGLYFYNTTTTKSFKYGLPQGLPSEVIYGILPDTNNNLWISTNYGLSLFNIVSKQFKNFDVSNGLLGNEFNYGAFVKIHNGNLMFGGENGINFFNPNSIVENSFIPKVFINSILVNNKPFLIQKNRNDEVELTYHQNDFSFNFVALSYSQPTKNQYAYKLEGFDTDWNYIGNKRTATYTNLDAGDYTFKVKASNSDGLWNEKGDVIKIKILPAPWETWWAYLIYLILFIAILYSIRKYSLLRIHEKNELKQERQEREKIEEINQMKLQLFTNISHDFRTPLTLIIGPLQRMMEKKIGNAYIQEQHENMYRNASVLLQLVNQLLDFRKSEFGKLHLKASRNNIVSFIENIKISFDELAKVKEINYVFHSTSPEIEVWFDTINLQKVVYNLLSNAFKFTPNFGEIVISVSTTVATNKKGKSSDFLELVIRDSGKGIPEKSLKHIFNRFYQLEEDENLRSGTGIGLSLTKNIVKLHKGIIRVISKEEEGTSFIVLLPLGNDHLNEDQMIFTPDIVLKSEELNYLEKINNFEKDYEPYNLNEEEEMDNSDKSRPILLLVEDNLEVRTFIKNIFISNYTVYEADNGQIAIEIAKTNIIDLVISDVMMPIMDGIELCAKIKTNILTSHIPVVLLTAKTSEESQNSAYTTGADAYITKPFDAKILEIRISNILKTRKSLIEKFRKDIILEPKELASTSADELFLQKAIDLIEQNMTNADFTINDFVVEMNMSRSVLYRKLKALTDQSLTEFIKTIKLKRAAQLILNTQLSISEIAFDLGFNDLKHFRISFQKLFNQLPSQYRANNASLIPLETSSDLEEEV